MPVLHITEDDVRELLDMEMAISILEELFEKMAAGEATNVPRSRAHAPGIYLHTMSAAAGYLGYVGWKAYTTTAKGMRFHVGLYSNETGELEALIEANYLGQMRTGAASGVATEYLARPEAHCVGVFGTGLQARSQLKAICEVRNIDSVVVYSRNVENRQQFADEMSEWCNTDVEPVDRPEDAASEVDIVICATTSRTPLFDGHDLAEGTHLNVIGSNFLEKAEIDVTTVHRSDVIVCDDLAQCRLEAGDFREAIEQGVTEWSLMHELSAVVAGHAPSRSTPEQITLFKSVGMAIEDIAVGAYLIKKARETGLGRILPIHS